MAGIHPRHLQTLQPPHVCAVPRRADPNAGKRFPWNYFTAMRDCFLRMGGLLFKGLAVVLPPGWGRRVADANPLLQRTVFPFPILFFLDQQKHPTARLGRRV